MAEMAPFPIADDELMDNTLIHDSHPSLELIEPVDNRLPQLGEDEANYLLERGRLRARLRAGIRVLSAAAAFANDEQMESTITSEYMASLRSDVKQLTEELQAFDAVPRLTPEEAPAIAVAPSHIEDMEPSFEIEPAATPVRRVGQRAIRSTANRDIEGRDSVGLYLEEIARTPLLNAEMEVELSKTIEAGLMAEQLLKEGRFAKNGKATSGPSKEELEWLAEEGERAVQQFIQSNLRLVVSIARKYGRAQMPMLDIIQEGNTGLIHAVEKFDYTKGYKFSTYASWWVRQAITRGISQQARAVRLPVHVMEEVNQVNSVRRTLERQLGRDVEPAEIAAELGMDIERVNDLISWSRDAISLDTPIDDDGETSLGDLMDTEMTPSPEENVLSNDSRKRLNELVDRLDERSADIIRRRFGLIDGRQHKLADIGLVHGVSAERIRQLEREAMAKLRRLANPELGEA